LVIVLGRLYPNSLATLTWECSRGAMAQPETYTFDDAGGIPNSRLPVLVYHEVDAAHDAGDCEVLFGRNGWFGGWVDGIFPFHHFHSTAHEVLGIVAGSVTVILGGPTGRRFQAHTGDVLVLPAGTGHCNAGASDDLLVVGAYPNGMRWDLRRGDVAERDEVLANVAAVPVPAADPVRGPDGALTELWSARGVPGQGFRSRPTG
jgi:uncharacterized protein YjlB